MLRENLVVVDMVAMQPPKPPQLDHTRPTLRVLPHAHIVKFSLPWNGSAIIIVIGTTTTRYFKRRRRNHLN
jgi:hypothetical protein